MADLLPSLAAYAGLLDPGGALTERRLTTYDGRVLAPDRGLAEQGVTPGTILVLQAAPVPPRYDDVVEAVADARNGPPPWFDATVGTLTKALVALVLLVGAVALVSDHVSPIAPGLAAAMAVVLLMCSAALSRVVHDAELAVLAAFAASVYAGTTGLLMAWASPLLGIPGAAAGGATAATAAVACAVLADHRNLLMPPALIGAVFLVAGSAAPVVDPATALTVAAVVAAAASLSFPTLAVVVTPTWRRETRGDPTLPNDGVDPLRVAHDVRGAHRLVTAWTATGGLLVLVVAPVAASSGLAGTISVALAALVFALEPAGSRGATAALVGGVSGTLGLITVVTSALWLHPQCRPVVAPVVAAAALLLLTDVSLRGGIAPAVRIRVRELAETAALIGLAPAVVLAVGSSFGLRLDLP